MPVGYAELDITPPVGALLTEDSYAASRAFRYSRSLPLRKGAGELMAEDAIKIVKGIVQ